MNRFYLDIKTGLYRASGEVAGNFHEYAFLSSFWRHLMFTHTPSRVSHAPNDRKKSAVGKFPDHSSYGDSPLSIHVVTNLLVTSHAKSIA